MHRDLGGTWTLYYAPSGSGCRRPEDLVGSTMACIEAEVPGNVELDLVRAGVVPSDLMHGAHILEIRPYEAYEWWYVKPFDLASDDGGSDLMLHFAGVDCWAEYWLNGTCLGSSENMLIAHDFPVRDVIRVGRNILAVHLRPVGELANTKPRAPFWAGLLPPTEEGAWVRKAPHMYGWDIMPRAVSAGIWRAVWLADRPAWDIEDLYVATLEATAQHATVSLSYELRMPWPEMRQTPCRLELRAACGDSRIVAVHPVNFSHGTFLVGVETPQLWWPYGYGPPHLYAAVVTLWVGDRAVAQKPVTFGIRTVALQRAERTESSPGRFQFEVNGLPVFARGTNWGPMDAFHSRDAAEYPEHLRALKEVQGNLVRLWGGNVYPDEALYAFCDREGIMIWQDFALACALYPQDEAFQQTMRTEVAAVVRQFRNHPALVLWCGDNEGDLFARVRHLPPAANRVTRETIPEILRWQDPYRPYIPSSPWLSGTTEAADGRDGPEAHLWGPRDYFKSAFYTEYPAPFVSEMGFMGLPAEATLRRYLDADQVWPPTNRQWLVHATDPTVDFASFYWERARKTFDRIGEFFGTMPAALPDVVVASQIVQAEGFKFAIEWARQQPEKTGLVWWSLFDGWPQVSDAVVDYYGERKLAYSYIQRSQRPLLVLMGEPRDDGYPVVISNHTQAAWSGVVRLTDGESQDLLWTGTAQAAPGEVAQVGHLALAPSGARCVRIEWKDSGRGQHNHYIVGTPPFSLDQYRAWLPQILAESREDDSATHG